MVMSYFNDELERECQAILARFERQQEAQRQAAWLAAEQERGLAGQVEALSRRLALLERTPERWRANARRNGAEIAVVIKRIGSTEERTFEGIASHVEADLVGDEVIPSGARYQLPLPLLRSHHHDEVIGRVHHAEIGRDAIKVCATIATIDEPGPLKDLCDGAWQSVRHRLWTALSIGFMPIKSVPIASGLRFEEWRWIETSLVACPANLRCRIGAG
jgi:hypothetical protein